MPPTWALPTTSRRARAKARSASSARSWAQASLGLSQDALSGLAFGVFGEGGIDVPVLDPTTGTRRRPWTVPAFGIALNAIKTSGSTNIISNPTLDDARQRRG